MDHNRHHRATTDADSDDTSSPPCKAPMSAPGSTDMLSGLLLEDAILQNAYKKITNPLDKTFFLAVLAGFWVGLGGIAALSVAGGIPVDVRNAWPFLPKLAIGLFFSFALHLILLFGGELFTGNVMVMNIGLLNRVTPPSRVALNLLTVYLGNWAGCLLTSYFFAYKTDLFVAEPYHSYLSTLTLSKITGHGWGVLFLRAIPANTLVCVAVVLGLASRDAAGKILALYFPVVMFVVSSFEHCVANMFFISTGLLYGAPSTIGRLWFNQSAAFLGNVVGGAFVVALSMHLMNHWVSLLPEALGGGKARNEDGTLAAHDIESTRRARDFATHDEAAAHKVHLRRSLSLSMGTRDGGVGLPLPARRRSVSVSSRGGVGAGSGADGLSKEVSRV